MIIMARGGLPGVFSRTSSIAYTEHRETTRPLHKITNGIQAKLVLVK